MDKKKFISIIVSLDNKSLVLLSIKKINQQQKKFDDDQIRIAIDASLQYLLEIGCVDDIEDMKMKSKEDVANELYLFNCKIIKHALKDLMRNFHVHDDVIEPDENPDELLNVKRKEIKISDRHTNYSQFSDSEDYKKREEGQDQKEESVSQEKTPRQLWMNP
jgi:hypothetical protein